MRKKLWIPVLMATILVAPTLTQQREKKKGPPDFHKEVAAATQAFDAKKYGACLAHLKQAEIAVTMLRRTLVLEVFPKLTDDYKVKDNKGYEDALNNPFASFIPMNLAGVIERTYRSGDKRLKITLTLDSPMAKTFGAMLGMMRDKNTEIVTYQGTKALLKKNGGGFELTMVLGNAHSLVAETTNISDEELLKIISQEQIDRIQKALAE